MIRVITDENELIFVNETKQCNFFRIKIKLTEEEWRQECFCVELAGNGDQISISLS